MNYPQIMSPVPFASKSGGHVPPDPIGAPPMLAPTLNAMRAMLAICDNYPDDLYIVFNAII